MLAETAVFCHIPTMRKSGARDLANRWFQPLTHVSEAAKRGYSEAALPVQPTRKHRPGAISTPLVARSLRRKPDRYLLRSSGVGVSKMIRSTVLKLAAAAAIATFGGASGGAQTSLSDPAEETQAPLDEPVPEVIKSEYQSVVVVPQDASDVSVE